MSPLRNRVLPTGEIVATARRGTVLGNRGCLHRRDGTVIRAWQLERWIACRLHFRGRHHPQAAPGRYTSLFFADEATALAAGHRPCAECRRADYTAFAAAYAAAHGLTRPPKAPELDAHMHADRIADDGRTQRTYTAPLETLPPGAMVLGPDGCPWLVEADCVVRRWGWGGLTASRDASPHADVTVLTPRATVATLAAGYPVAGVAAREG